MARTTKEQAAYDLTHVRSMLESCHGGQPKIWTVYIPTTGASRQYRVFTLRHARMVDLTPHTARIAGYRYNPGKQSLIVNGHGFSGPNEIADGLTRALGFDVAYEEA
jgi:hypothetical protein